MDISDWYSDMMSRGAFDGHLTTEQSITKGQIDDMIEESARTNMPKIVSRKTLEKYESIFKVFELKDETEMDEEDADGSEEDSNSFAGDEFAGENDITSPESGDENDINRQKETDDYTNELEGGAFLDSSEPKSSENFTESNNQSITKKGSWRNNLEKCYLNSSGSGSSSRYLDVFYKYGSFIQDSTQHFRGKSSAFKKRKKKKSRKRKGLRTRNVCWMKNGCCLRCWLSFEFKMCIPQFNWLLENVTHNGVQLEMYLPFPDSDFEKGRLLLEDREKEVDGKTESKKSRVSVKSGGKYEKQVVNGIKMPEDKKESEIKERDDYRERGLLEKKYNGLRAKRRSWLKSTERTVEKLLRMKKANMEDDLNVDKVTKIIDEKSKEQLIKIQTLELSISKLENRILREQLSQTNDSSSINRLENHILRLENELIKINQTYLELRQENEQLKKGQRRYLELSQGPKKTESKVSTGPAPVNYTLVIKQYETRLTELTYQLRNQSELVSKFKKQLEHVEDQNRILYQIVMNQSLLISQVMKKIQILSDQIQETNKNKHEGSGLMTQTELIKHLENMVNINRKSRQTKKRASSARRQNSRQSLKYHYYKTCMSKKCSKFDVLDQHKVQILSTSNRQMKGGLPKSATVKISNYEEKNPLEKKTLEKEKEKEKAQKKDAVKDDKIFNVESRPPAKTEKMETKVTIPSEKKQKDDESKEKIAKAKADDSRVEKSRDVGKGSKEKIRPDSNVVKVAGSEKMADKVTSGKKIASGRKKPLYEDPENKDPKDCYELYQKGNNRNGAYKIKPAGFKKFIEVFCDMKNGGWTVIQRRQGGTTNFFRDWSMYKKGFGGVYGEHWIGNDVIHHLTNQKECKLRIDLTDWNKNKVIAFYNYFMVEHESEGYLLHVEGFSGEGGDSFSKHNLNKFSTKDVDNDRVTKQFGGSCANRFTGAWWYHKCYSSNLNGVFYRNGVVAEKKFDGVAWKSWKGPNYSMMKTEIKIAPTAGDMK